MIGLLLSLALSQGLSPNAPGVTGGGKVLASDDRPICSCDERGLEIGPQCRQPVPAVEWRCEDKTVNGKTTSVCSPVCPTVREVS
jgi:hypothetical protein